MKHKFSNLAELIVERFAFIDTCIKTAPNSIAKNEFEITRKRWEQLDLIISGKESCTPAYLEKLRGLTVSRLIQHNEEELNSLQAGVASRSEMSFMTIHRYNLMINKAISNGNKLAVCNHEILKYIRSLKKNDHGK